MELFDKIINLRQKVLTKLKNDEKVVASNSKYLGINEFGSSNINYLIQINSVQEFQYRVRSETLKFVKEAYERNNLKITYEQIEVHYGANI